MLNVVKREKAVTLIALIITIIVLLILAGIAFSSLLGSNGLLNRASDAGDVSKRASENEEIALQEYENEIGKWGDPPGGEDHVGSITEDGVPIPKGFTYITGTKDTGTVIKDANDNEFVWVPVADLDANGTRDGTNYTEKFGRRKFGMSVTLGGTVASIYRYTEDIPSEVIDSVEEYGGFYIARYQASYGSGNTVENYKPLSKSSTTQYLNSMSYTTRSLWIEATLPNAVQICSNMYDDDASVVSLLPFGAHWDSTMQFLLQTAFYGVTDRIGFDSREWGNYVDSTFEGAGEGSWINTGSTENTMQNNIYDLAGNLVEWTQEKYSTGTATVVRSGYYLEEGGAGPAGKRWNSADTIFSGSVRTFRPVLIIKVT